VFSTGRDFTLFHNGRIHSSGSVGLGLEHALGRLLCSHHVPGLTPLTSPLLVTKSVVGTLLYSNFALIELLERTGISFMLWKIETLLI
jgi:hypothetical protein